MPKVTISGINTTRVSVSRGGSGGGGSDTGAHDTANAAYLTANAAFAAANAAAGGGSSGPFAQANTAYNQANAAFLKANSANLLAFTGNANAAAAFNNSNGAFSVANTANVKAGAAFDQANTATSDAALASGKAGAAFDKANSANLLASASFGGANAAAVQAQLGRDRANAAFSNLTISNTGTYTWTENVGSYAATGASANTIRWIQGAGVILALDTGNNAIKLDAPEPIGVRAYAHANSGYDKANSSNVFANTINNTISYSSIALAVNSQIGVASPTNPLAGDPFDLVTRAMAWDDANIKTPHVLRINLGTGNVVEANSIFIPQRVNLLKFVGTGASTSKLIYTNSDGNQTGIFSFGNQLGFVQFVNMTFRSNVTNNVYNCVGLDSYINMITCQTVIFENWQTAILQETPGYVTMFQTSFNNDTKSNGSSSISAIETRAAATIDISFSSVGTYKNIAVVNPTSTKFGTVFRLNAGTKLNLGTSATTENCDSFIIATESSAFLPFAGSKTFQHNFQAGGFVASIPVYAANGATAIIELANGTVIFSDANGSISVANGGVISARSFTSVNLLQPINIPTSLGLIKDASYVEPFLIANNAYNNSNSAFGAANAAFDKANTANLLAFVGGANAAAAFGQANTATSEAALGRVRANASFSNIYVTNVATGLNFTQNVGSIDATALTDNVIRWIAGSFQVMSVDPGNNAIKLDVTLAPAWDTANSAVITSAAAFGMANSAVVNAAAARAHANSAYAKANAALANTDGVVFTGELTLTGNLTVIDEAYNSSTWDGNFDVPTKNAVRDKIEAIVGASGDPSAAFDRANASFSNLIISNTGSFTWVENTGFFKATVASANNIKFIQGAGIVISIDSGNNAVRINSTATGSSDLSAPFNQANTARDQANTARDTANGAYTTANGAFGTANSAASEAALARATGNAAFTMANSAVLNAAGAFAGANAAAVQAQIGRDRANAAFSNVTIQNTTTGLNFTQNVGSFLSTAATSNTIRFAQGFQVVFSIDSGNNTVKIDNAGDLYNSNLWGQMVASQMGVALF
jgi:hypothetical protein